MNTRHPISAIAIAAASAALAFPAHAQFEARDIDGNGVTDAYYDVAQDISWMADANLYATLGGPLDRNPYVPDPSFPNAYLPAGEVLYTTAVNWVSNLVVAGLDGWRLPQRLIPSTDPGWDCPPAQCAQTLPIWPSELSFLATALGGGTGPFSNVMNGNYLTSTPDVRWLELRNVVTGFNVVSDEYGFISGYAWAVHDGDVGNGTPPVTPVPEPATYLTMTLGLLGVGAVLRRRRRGDASGDGLGN